MIQRNPNGRYSERCLFDLISSNNMNVSVGRSDFPPALHKVLVSSSPSDY